MNFDTSLISQILGWALGAGGVGVAILERRKNNAITKGVEADADGKDIQNGKELISMYQNAMDDMTARAEKKLEEIIAMYDRKIKVLEDEIRLHKRLATALRKENADLRKQLKDAKSNRTI